MLIVLSLGCACLASSPFLNAQCDQTCDSDGNTFLGAGAGSSTTSGFHNTGIGNQALFENTLGWENTAVGRFALIHNTTGFGNTATGSFALFGNITGGNNSAFGFGALSHNTSGNHNVAVGQNALIRNETGSNNIALGPTAGRDIKNGNWNIHIGSKGPDEPHDEAQTIRIGDSQIATYIAGISGTTVTSGAAVFVDSNGQLGTVTSSKRFKEEIRPMNNVSEAIFSLEPVTFRYKQGIDAQHVPQFGLVAEDVDKVNPALVVRDKQGRPYTVRYEAINAMVLNEFLKEHAAFAKEQRKVAQLEKQVAILTAGLQKVSDQLEANKPASQVVANDQ